MRGSRRSWASTRGRWLRWRRRSCASCLALRARAARRPRRRAARKARLDVRRAGALAQLGGGAGRRAGARRASAAGRRSERPRPSRGWRPAASTPRSARRWNERHEVRRRTGSSPTVGSSSTSTSGWPSNAVPSETRARCPPERPHRRSAASGELDDRSVSATRARRAEHAGEVAQVLADGEVDVDGGRLGHVGDPRAQRRTTGRLAEHAHVARLDELHADDGAQQRGLAAAARPEQAGDAPAGDGEVEPVEHAPVAARDVQAADRDRRGRLGRLELVEHVLDVDVHRSHRPVRRDRSNQGRPSARP